MPVVGFIQKNIFAAFVMLLLVLVLALGASGESRGKKPPLEDNGGSVNHKVETGRSRQEPPASGSVNHEIQVQPNNPPPVYAPPVVVPVVTAPAPVVTQPAAAPVQAPAPAAPVARQEPKPIVVITNQPQKEPAVQHTVKPELRDGRYYYPTRPDYGPSYYGHWIFDNQPDPYRSAYYYYDYYPFVDSTRVYVIPYDQVDFNTKYIYNDNPYLSNRPNAELDYTLASIRQAWLEGRSDLISAHVNKSQMIAVFLDGKYDYSIQPEDYIQMTFDAIDRTKTLRFTWESLRQKTNGDCTAFARHTYQNAEGKEQVVYVSYTLTRLADNFIILEVGSSKTPLN